METRAHYILVGLATLAAVTAAMLFMLWMSGAGAQREVQYFEVLFNEPVSGLSEGSPVQYSGIRVGEVERLSLDVRDPRIVRAVIRVSTSAPVKVDTLARQTLLNITGASAIELSEGLPESPLLTAPSGIPVIEATPSSLAQLRLSSEELLLGMTSLLERANNLLSDENASRVARVLDNVETVSSALAEQQQNLQDSIINMAESSQSLSELLAQLNDQTTRYGEPVLASVADTITNLQLTSEQLQALVSENSPAVASGMQSFAELGPAVRDLRSILNNLDNVTSRISDNPADFLLGSDNIREYRP